MKRERHWWAFTALALAGAAALVGCGGGSGADTDAAAASPGGGDGLMQAQAALTTWNRCAVEGAHCSFTGTRTVRYGYNGRYLYKKLAGGIACTNEAFGGDPVRGADKFCELAVEPTAPPPAAETWTQCAVEEGRCSFTGTREVRYGAAAKYAYRTATGGIDCNNNVFGDPNPGADKVCEVKSGTPTTPTPTAKSPVGQNAADYVLTFSEEFDGATYDKSKWNDRLWYTTYPNPDQTPNWAVNDGKLKMFPVQGTSLDRDYRHFTTDGKFEQTYGYFEMEAKLPYGNGVWPAFWLYNHKSPDGAVRPEIDIIETYPGGGTDYGYGDDKLRPTVFAATVHRGDNNQVGSKMHATGLDLSAGFHQYAVKWEPDRMTFYFDGKPIYTLNESMGEPMFLLLSLQMCGPNQAGWCPIAHPNLIVPGQANSFEVNYVRAWQFKK